MRRPTGYSKPAEVGRQARRGPPLSKEGQEKSRKRSKTQEPEGPPLPSNGQYQAATPDPLRANKIAALGFDDSQLRPAAAPATSWYNPFAGWGWRPGRRSLGELSKSAWRPPRMQFHAEWPDEDLETDWVELVYVHLYVRVSDLTNTYFGYGDIPPGTSIWRRAGLSRQFQYYASLIAREDKLVGTWDTLLESRLYRKYLVTGVIGKVLQTSVFDELLFGASKAQKTMLEGQDEATLQVDGYRRTHIRSRLVRSALGDELLTPEFWPEVDRLALQITDLLLPLIRVLDGHFPASAQKSIRDIYQDIHHIVAEAAFLHIGTRWSGDIFRFTSVIPGQPWAIDQQNADSEVFERSRAAVGRLEDIFEARWKASRAERQRRRRAAAAGPSAAAAAAAAATLPARAVTATRGVITATRGMITTGLRRVGLGAEPELDDASVDDDSDMWYPPSRLAKVQIGIWPMLQRFTPGRDDSGGGGGRGRGRSYLDAAGAPPDGETITTVLKSQVVYYSGLADPASDHYETLPSLKTWVRRQRLAPFRRVGRWLLVAAGVWLGLSLAAVAVGQGALALAAVRVVGVWGREVLVNGATAAVGLFKTWAFVLLAGVNWVRGHVLGWDEWALPRVLAQPTRGFFERLAVGDGRGAWASLGAEYWTARGGGGPPVERGPITAQDEVFPRFNLAAMRELATDVWREVYWHRISRNEGRYEGPWL